ncbi:hypothetical protein BJ741DRAFT_644754 [Chytriomyces cf. hyalinus JEL632]|nr:hypothetical protein BJ741DRAFT_644754 [Chytriomyces cf. hyalinus JEL632]
MNKNFIGQQSLRNSTGSHTSSPNLFHPISVAIQFNDLIVQRFINSNVSSLDANASQDSVADSFGDSIAVTNSLLSTPESDLRRQSSFRRSLSRKRVSNSSFQTPALSTPKIDPEDSMKKVTQFSLVTSGIQSRTYDYKGRRVTVESLAAFGKSTPVFYVNGIHPRSLFSNIWDLSLGVVMSALMWLIPFVTAYNPTYHIFDINILATTISVIFLCDSVVSLITPQLSLDEKEFYYQYTDGGCWKHVPNLVQYAIFLGAISSAVMEMNPSGRLFDQKVGELRDYIRSKDLSKDTEIRLLTYYETRYRGKYFEENALLSDLNDSLKAVTPVIFEILLQNTRKLIVNVPFLKRAAGDGRDKLFMGRIAAALRSINFIPVDFVTKQGDSGSDMYFILTGKAEVYVNERHAVTLGAGAYFGEVGLITKTLRTATVQAVLPSLMYRLTYLDFHRILNDFNDFNDMRLRMDMLAEEREKYLETTKMKPLHIPVHHPKQGCPACQARLGITPALGNSESNKLHAREWQTVGVPVRTSNKPGFAFTPMDPYCAFHSNARNNNQLQQQENGPAPFIVPSPPPRNRTATGLRLPLKRTPSIQSRPQNLSNPQTSGTATPPTTPSKDRNAASRLSLPVPSRIPTAATTSVPVRQSPPAIHRTSLPVPVPRNRSSFVFKVPSVSDLRLDDDPDYSDTAPIGSIHADDDVMEEVVDEELTMEELAVADGDDTVCGEDNQAVPVEDTPVIEETSIEDSAVKNVDVAVEEETYAEDVELKGFDPVVEEAPAEQVDSVVEEAPSENTEAKTADPVVEIQFIEEEVMEGSADVVEEMAASATPVQMVTENRPAKLEIAFETETVSPVDSNDSVKNQLSPTDAQTPLDKYIESNNSKNFNSAVDQDDDGASLISYDFHGSDGMTSIAPSIFGAASNFEPLSNHLHPPSRFSTVATAAHRRRARKPIDMTNLTLLHHLLTTRLSDMQTHHAALLHHPSRYSNSSSNEQQQQQQQQQLLRSHHKSSYLNSAREIIFLGKGIAKSWQPVARGCRDKWLGERLLLSLQRIDTLSAQMKGVLGSHVRNSSSADVDAEGTVLTSAVEVVKAAEGALRDLEAVSVKAFEKDTPETGENDEKASGDVDQLGDMISLKNGLSERELAVRKRRSYAESLLDYGEDDGASAVEFSGMEGMQEALNIAMRAAEKVE